MHPRRRTTGGAVWLMLAVVGTALIGFAVPGRAEATPSRPDGGVVARPVAAIAHLDGIAGGEAPSSSDPVEGWRSPRLDQEQGPDDPDGAMQGGSADDATSLVAGRAQASQVTTSNWVPFVGTHWVACTRSNPSPGGVCATHHPYIGAVDFAMPIGSPVHASGPGQVVYVNTTCALGHVSCEGGAGRWVGVAHADGRVSRYMHLDTVGVSLGQWVVRGQYLGTGGITGNAVIAHLHYDEQKPLWTRTHMGELFACHGQTFVRYPQAAGYDTWEEVPYGTPVRNDGMGCVGSVFFDVGPASPFRAEIAWAAASGVTDGFSDGTFQPTGPVTRQAVAAWMHRLGGAPPGPFTAHGFGDVSPTHPFRVPIGWMASTGRSTGYADGTFRPLDCVTRQAMVAFLFRELGGTDSGSPPGFADVGPDHLFGTEIAWASAQGLVTGFPDGTFRPGTCVTRQAAMAFLHRAFV